MTFEYLKFRLMSVRYLYQLSIQSDSECRKTITFQPYPQTILNFCGCVEGVQLILDLFDFRF
jgi:hypothetical protein